MGHDTTRRRLPLGVVCLLLLPAVLCAAPRQPRGGRGQEAPSKPAPERRDAGAEPPTAAPAAFDLDLERPAVSLTKAVDQAEGLAALRPQAVQLEARLLAKPGSPTAVRDWLACALVHHFGGDRVAVKRCALQARQLAVRAGATSGEAFALLVMHLNLSNLPDERQEKVAKTRVEPVQQALALYRKAGNPAGVQLARALLAQDLARKMQRLDDGHLARVGRDLEGVLSDLSAAAAVPLADLNAAWAAHQAAERLDELAGEAEPKGLSRNALQMRSEALARRALDNVHEPESLVGLAALNLVERVRLELGTGTPRSQREEFVAYDDRVTALLQAADEPVTLLTGASGLMGNINRFSEKYGAQIEAADFRARARRLMRLAKAALPLAERPTLSGAAADRALGLPEPTNPLVYGIEACKALTSLRDELPPDVGAGMSNYLDFGFWFYEQAKAVNLSRTLARLTGEERLSRSDLQRRNALSQERSALAVKLFHAALAGQGEPGSGPLAGAAKGLADRYGKVRDDLLAIELGNDSEARQAAQVINRQRSADAARQELTDDHTAIVAEGYDWAFVLTCKRVAWTFPEPDLSRARVAKLASLVGDKAAGQTARVRAAQTLYTTYFRPLEGSLVGVDRLVLVPDGPLACLPFEALVSGAAAPGVKEPTTWTQAQFVGDRFAVDYIPSMTMMALAQARRRGAERHPLKTLLAIGDVKVGEQIEVGQQGTRFVLVPTRGGGKGENELLQLPFAGLEARRVVAEVGEQKSTLLVGDQATEKAVRAQLGQHQILHFATHGVMPSDGDPLGAGLLLAPEPDGKSGLLTAREVYQLKLPAQMAVLSACDTANGAMHFVSGGVTSLAGAFLYAGVPTVVASLWPVDDQATAELMQNLYRNHLRNAVDEAVALRQAKLSLRTAQGGKWADPYYWAPFLMFR